MKDDLQMMVRLEAQVSKFEKDLNKAVRTQRRAADRMERMARQNADRIGKAYDGVGPRIGKAFAKMPAAMKGMGTAFLGGVAGGIAAGGVTQIVGNLSRVTKEVATLGDEAERAGLSAQVFQEWKFVADQNRIGVDALVDSFKELNLRADEFIVTGVGPAAEAFARLGYRADDLNRKLKDPSDLMLEILDRMENFDTAGQIRIADEIFGGTGGERMVELLGQGRGALQETINRAHEVGAVLDDELIAKAQEVDRKFNELTTTVGNFGKRAAVAVAEVAAEMTDFRARLDVLIPDEAQGRAILGDEVYDTLAQNRDLLDQNTAAVQQVDQEFQILENDAASTASALREASADLRGLGHTGAADELDRIAFEMDEVTKAFRNGEISGDDMAVKLGEVQTAAEEAFTALGDVGDTYFTPTIKRLAGLGATIATVAAQARGLAADLAKVAGVDAGTKQGEAMRQRQDAEKASMDSLNAMREANDRFTASEEARNAATAEQLRLQKEVEAVKTRAQAAGAAVTTSQAEELARAAIAGEEARKAAEAAARSADAAGGGGGGGAGTAKLDDLTREAQAIRDKTAALQIEAAVLTEVATSQRSHADAAGFAEAKTRLLIAAQQSGQTVTPALLSQIDGLAAAYSRAGDEAEKAAEKMAAVAEQEQRARDATRTGAEAVTDVFMAAGRGADALSNALNSLAEQIIRNMALRMFMNLPGMGSLGGMLSPPTGFAEGGYTGAGGKYQVAGLVHAGEYVLSKEAVSRIGVANLERLHSAAKSGYATGGYVTTMKAARVASGQHSGSTAVQNISLAPAITVNTSGGTPEQNADLADQIGKQTERAMRGLIQDELVKQMRPGAMLGRR